MTHLRNNKRLFIFGLVAALILLGAFAMRTVNLTKLPVFADEAIYIRWSQVMKAEPTLRFLPQSDGKQPLFMWLTMPMFKLFADPLFAGRFVSVLSGMGTIVGIGVLSYLLFRSKKLILLAMGLYTLSPFSFFFHRMALVDSTLTLFGIWTAIGGLLIAQTLRLDIAMLTGFSLGAAWLTKSPALFFALLMPANLLFLKQFSPKKIILGLILFMVAVGMGYGFYNILRLGPNFHMIASRNLDYVLPYTHILTNPRDPFIFHTDRALEWIFILGPWPILFLAVFSVFALLYRYPKQILWLVLLFAFPLLVQAQYAKVFTARYIFFALPPLFILASGFILLKKRSIQLLGGALVLFFILISLQNIYFLITDPSRAYLPESERSGYLVEWTAGHGIAEVADYIKEKHSANPESKIVIGTEGFFGTLPDGLQMYLERVPNVTVIGTGLNFTDVPQSLKDARAAGNQVYFVVNDSRMNFVKDFKEYGLKVINTYKKSPRAIDSHDYVVRGPSESLYFFEVGERML